MAPKLIDSVVERTYPNPVPTILALSDTALLHISADSTVQETAVATTTSNTIDTSSGEILDGVTFKAPKSSSIISPITTVMVETGLSKEKVSESLGIAGVDILTFNPFDDGVDEQKALSMEKVSHQTLLTINAISSAAKDSGIDEDKAFELGMSAFSKKIIEINNTSSSTVIDLSNESTIDDFITVAKTVIKDAGGDDSKFQQVSETLGENVKTNNKKISDLKDMDSTDAKTAFANSAKITKLVEDAIKELNLPKVTTPSADECVSVDVASPTVTPATPTSSSLCIDEVSTTSPTTTPTTSPVPPSNPNKLIGTIGDDLLEIYSPSGGVGGSDNSKEKIDQGVGVIDAKEGYDTLIAHKLLK